MSEEDVVVGGGGEQPRRKTKAADSGVSETRGTDKRGAICHRDNSEDISCQIVNQFQPSEFCAPTGAEMYCVRDEVFMPLLPLPWLPWLSRSRPPLDTPP